MRTGPLFALALLTTSLPGRDIHVGKDAPSIAHAIKMAQPGDTIHLEPKVYHDYAGFYEKHGEPGKPITLDGHGATLDGSDALDPAQWVETAPGLFKAENLLPRFDDAMLMRWFFVFDGKLQFMGRTSKGTKTPLKTPEQLQPGEWTFVETSSAAAPNSRLLHGAFYLKLAPGTKLADAAIRIPRRSAGVQFGSKNSHLVIRNLTATRPYNDGFNIHGTCHDVVFENIAAIDCGDDGISAHGNASYRVHGFVSMGNSTGICDTGHAETSYENVFIARCIGFDLFFLDYGRYRIRNAIVLSSAQNPFMVTGREDGTCELELHQAVFRRVGEAKQGHIGATAKVLGTGVSLVNFSFTTRGVLDISGSADEAAIFKGFPASMKQAALKAGLPAPGKQ